MNKKVIAIIVVVLGIAGFFVWRYLNQNGKSELASTNSSTQNVESAQKEQADNQIDQTTNLSESSQDKVETQITIPNPNNSDDSNVKDDNINDTELNNEERLNNNQIADKNEAKDSKATQNTNEASKEDNKESEVKQKTKDSANASKSSKTKQITDSNSLRSRSNKYDKTQEIIKSENSNKAKQAKSKTQELVNIANDEEAYKAKYEVATKEEKDKDELARKFESNQGEESSKDIQKKSDETSKSDSNNIEQNQIQYDIDRRYLKCEITPQCNDNEVAQRVVVSSLKSHAKTRYKEVLATKGEKSARNFIDLWNRTSDIVLPKLTSHVSNISEQSLDDNGFVRICKVRYYTEVLDDFGNGWKDKKGDKSPTYEASYSITCSNDKSMDIKILSNTIHRARQNEDSNQPYLANKEKLPLCTDDIVYKKLSQVSIRSQAQARAQEERRKNGDKSWEKFMQLWDKTQPMLHDKIASRIENIQSNGLDNNAKSRICSAYYYTEVLEDFGNGWRDKKGDKSPKYEVYFTIRYLNEHKNDVIIKILSQNKMRK